MGAVTTERYFHTNLNESGGECHDPEGFQY